MKYRVIKDYSEAPSNPIMITAGEKLAAIKESDPSGDWPDWIFCKGEGKEGWVPRQILTITGTEAVTSAVSSEDYCARELNLTRGEVLTAERQLNGWIWGAKEIAPCEKGWAPLNCLEQVDHPDYTIRTMKMEDYEEVYRLWTETEGMGLRSLDDSEEGIGRFLKRNPATCFLCRSGEKLAGVILCGHDGRRGYIYHAAVDKAFRRRGIGKALVNKVLTALEKEGINKTALVVFDSNTAGNSFWESLGFTERCDLIYRNRAVNESNT